MNILVLTNLYPPHSIGGYEERCRDSVEALRARGHQVQVLTSDYQAAPATPEAQVHRRLKIHGFFGHPWLPIHRLYRLEQFNHCVLRELLQQQDFDLVHVWNMGGLSKSLLHRLEAQALPVVYDVSDHWIAQSLQADVWLSWWNQPGTLWRGGLRALATGLGLRRWIDRRIPTAPVSQLRFEQIYFCSDFLRQLTARRGYPVQHAQVIHCGVPTARFTRKTHFQPARSFIWVGRLTADKDPLTAIRGLLAARQRSGLELTLDLYGSGPPEYRDSLQQHIRQADAQDFIQIKSAPREQMYARYARYDGYLFTSNWGEPFALTPLEAMAAGVPVIMCPDGGDAELLEDGVNALGFPAGSPPALADALLRLIESPDHGAAISARAYHAVQQHYSTEHMLEQIERCLQQAITTAHA